MSRGCYEENFLRVKFKLKHAHQSRMLRPGGGRVDNAFDLCSKDTRSNPAEAGHCLTTVGQLFTPTVPSGAEDRLNHF